MALAPLFPEEIQFQAKNGRNLTAGWLNVYLAGTDDVAETFCDYGVTRNPQDIVLDDNGRAVVICESGVAYRLEVFDSEGTLLWTEEPIYCEGTGSGSGGNVEVESTDGSIYVSKTVAAGTTTFDLSTNTGDVPEMAEWGRFKAPAVSTPGALQLARVDGNIDVDTGVKLVAGNHYHVTAEVTITPDGTGINYRTVTFELQDLDGNILASRTDSVDTSTSEPVTPELSVDLFPTVDVEVVPVVSWDDDIASVEIPRMDVHRFYAGFRAVPNTVATKTWVSANFLPNSASGDFVPWSGLEGTGGTITAISGSGIGTNYTTVSSIASSYAYSAASSKVDQSAFDSCCSAMSGYISAITSDTADISAAVSAITGQTGNYIPWSASGEFQPSGNYVSASDMSAYVEKSSISAESSVWNEASGMSGKLDNSASSTWYPMTGNPSGFLTAHQELTSVIPWSALSGEDGKITGISGSGLKGHEYSGIHPVVVDNTADTISVHYSGLQVDSSMTAYPSGSSIVLGVKDGVFQPSGDYYSASNPSGFITGVDLSDYATTAYVDSSVSGKQDSSSMSAYQLTADMTAYQPSGDYYSASNPSGFITGVDLSDYATTAYVDSSVSGKQDASAMTAYQLSGDYYSASNPSGFITGVDLSDYATTAYVDSSVSGKLDATASSQFLTAVPAGYATESYVDSAVSGVEITFDSSISTASSTSGITAGVNTGILSSYALSADVSGTVDTVANNSASWGVSGIDSATCSAIASSYAESAASGKLDTTAFNSGDFYTTANESGYVNSAYVESAVSGVEITFDSSITTASGTSGITAGVNTAILSAYQLTADMSAYQPSGDYAYNSSLSGYIPTSESSQFITSLAGYATEGYVDSSVSGKLDATASSQFYLTSNPAGYITGVDLSPYQLTADMSGYIPTSESANYQPASAMTAYQPSGDYAYNSSLSGYATEAYVDSSVSSKLDTTAFSDVSGTFLTSVDLTPYQLTADMSGYIPTSESANYQPASAMTAYQLSGDYAYSSAVSGKQDASAMTAYQEVSGMTAYQPAGDYQPSGDYAYNSSLSGYIPTSESSKYVTSLAGYATESYVDSAVSGVEITFDSSITTASGTSGITAGVNTSILSPYQMTADMSGYIPTSESANYQQVSAMTAYQPSGDYATTAYVESAVSGVEITFDSSITTASGTSGITAGVNTAILSAYQLTADMTAYQPSGDYIYASALGTGVI